ncbi:MAG: pyruvate:ferredoxin (flavodoxin) oxidoreductase, partial [Planctomycetota bacterium]
MVEKRSLDANEAVAQVAYLLNEVIIIYPITPASPMGEWCDSWSAQGKSNLWGSVPKVVEMESEMGAAGALHGALQTGALATTFTASQGLLLMIPNMYKIAGELTPGVIHVAARSVACQALSIFCDHSDVMATRGTGFAILASNNVQEAQDFALLAHLASLKSRIPFLHFFDGFRTSHEISKIELIPEDVIQKMLDEQWILQHRSRALSPDRPFIRGTAQNPDVFFQARESVNPFYQACPEYLEEFMQNFGQLTGRHYHLYEYEGDPEAEQVMVIMGSGAEAASETVSYLNQQGEKVGLLKVRLYRPFVVEKFCKALPKTVKSIAVLDRTKEPGSGGEPLYLDVLQAVWEGLEKGWLNQKPKIIGGRYGLSSKEFNPSMVNAIFEELKKEEPKNHFTIGIEDDMSHTSLSVEKKLPSLDKDVFQAMFYGLGSDGTVSANKNSIKIIGEETDLFVQGFFVYDSKKSGAMTVSHLRFGPHPIRSTYLIEEADFIGCHQTIFLEKFPIYEKLKPGGTFLLNTPYPKDEVWDRLPAEYQKALQEKKARFFAIDAYKVAKENGLGRRINTIMQACFFQTTSILPMEKARKAMEESIRKSYGKQGEYIVEMNIRALGQALENLYEVEIPDSITSNTHIKPPVPENAPTFVKEVVGEIIAGRGDLLPVSKFPPDGTYPSGTSKWEKRNIALEIPVWEPDICIQCGKCALVCPHAVIRIKAYEESYLSQAPAAFKSTDAKDKELKGLKFTIQVAPEDCTGCALCVDVCPARSKEESKKKAINMAPQLPLREQESKNWDFFLSLPEFDRTKIKVQSIRMQQLEEPLFEFSGACAGCGETPYLKLMTQLFGDRALVANATGCSSIYGGNLPTTPWSVNREGRGPAWSNSLFEDNAQFGLGFRVSLDKQTEYARELVKQLASQIGEELAKELLESPQTNEEEIRKQRERVSALKEKLEKIEDKRARQLYGISDLLVKKSVWIVGGDGWAYDIGYGGLDHVLASGYDVNLLVLDTEVYSNTGGQR